MNLSTSAAIPAPRLDDSYKLPFQFIRKIDKLTFNLGPTQMTSNEQKLTQHALEKAERDARALDLLLVTDLTPREFAILEYMMRNAGKPVTRATLSEEVWNTPHDPSTNIVDVYMKYVRDKVDRPGEPKLTHTIRGIGYELREA